MSDLIKLVPGTQIPPFTSFISITGATPTPRRTGGDSQEVWDDPHTTFYYVGGTMDAPAWTALSRGKTYQPQKPYSDSNQLNVERAGEGDPQTHPPEKEEKSMKPERVYRVFYRRNGENEWTPTRGEYLKRGELKSLIKSLHDVYGRQDLEVLVKEFSLHLERYHYPAPDMASYIPK